MPETAREDGRPIPLGWEPGPGSLRTRLAVVLAWTATGGLWGWLRGPSALVRVSTPTDLIVPYWYVLAIFPVLGILTADLTDCLRSKGLTTRAVDLAVQLSILVAASTLRVLWFIPLSGHAHVLTYFVLRRLWLASPSPRVGAVELALAFALLAATVHLKLFVWSDPVTLGTGAGLGLLQALVSRRVAAPAVRPGSG